MVVLLVMDVGMPWFYRKLPVPVADDFEVCICKDEAHTLHLSGLVTHNKKVTYANISFYKAILYKWLATYQR